ncbi:hypothetical protein G9J85_001845 [Escherichia coli]|nr:hypothetical protein [Escherichia coli]
MFDFASYHRAATLADAINLLADNPQAKLLAGGTDVLIQLHHHNDRYRHIVDIHNLAELRGITLAEDGSLRIGSATTFTQLIEDPITQRHLPALCAAATSIAGPQIRNVATYGGNICNGATSADSAAPTPIRCQHAEQTAQNAPLNLQTLEAISESVLQDVAPRSSWRASKEFRLHLIQTMTKKVISEAVAAAGGKLQ